LGNTTTDTISKLSAQILALSLRVNALEKHGPILDLDSNSEDDSSLSVADHDVADQVPAAVPTQARTPPARPARINAPPAHPRSAKPAADSAPPIPVRDDLQSPLAPPRSAKPAAGSAPPPPDRNDAQSGASSLSTPPPVGILKDITGGNARANLRHVEESEKPTQETRNVRIREDNPLTKGANIDLRDGMLNRATLNRPPSAPASSPFSWGTDNKGTSVTTSPGVAPTLPLVSPLAADATAAASAPAQPPQTPEPATNTTAQTTSNSVKPKQFTGKEPQRPEPKQRESLRPDSTKAAFQKRLEQQRRGAVGDSSNNLWSDEDPNSGTQ
jgi:hypothetical protein